MCWFCHWGWPSEIADIYERYEPTAGNSAMHYGPAHVVWEDENFARHHVQWCLDHFNEYLPEDSTTVEIQAVKDSLLALLKLPDSVLEPRPDYWLENKSPDQFPPPAGMTMRRV